MDFLHLVWFTYLVPIFQSIVNEIRTFVFTRCYKSIHIQNTVLRYFYVKSYLTEYCKHVHSLTMTSNLLEYENYNKNDARDLGVFGIPEGKYYIRFQKHIITIWLKEKEMWICTVAWRDFSVLYDFIYACRQNHIEKHSKNVVIYKQNAGHWNISKSVHPRDMSGIVTPNKKPILGMLDDFVANEAFYKRTGISFKKGMLLYGIPGTGKTSIITALAKRYNMKVCIVNPEKDLDAMDTMYDNTIMLFEDIDRYFKPVRNTKDSVDIVGWEPTFNLQKMLNVLDGITSPHKCIIILTANNKDVIPGVVLRPGRIDAQYEFSYASQQDIIDYTKFFYEHVSNTLASKIARKLAGKQVTISALQCHFLQYYNDPARALETIDALRLGGSS